MNKTFFAYHITHVFGRFSLESYHTRSEKITERDLVYVISGDKTAQGGVDYWLEGVFRVHRRHPGPHKLIDRDGRAKEFTYRLSLEPVRLLDRPISLATARWYSRMEIHQFFSSGQNFNPLPTDPNYKERFDLLLAEFGLNVGVELAEDLAELQATVPDVTIRQTLALARVGQGLFRAEVIKLWGRGEVCALTGIAVPELLIASHIKPWCESTDEERLSPANGLLLATHVDKLFDRHLISFKPENDGYAVAVHPRVQRVVSDLGIKKNARLNDSFLGLSMSTQLRQYLNDHYTRFCKKVAEDRPAEQNNELT